MRILQIWDSSTNSTWNTGHFISRALKRLDVQVANFAYSQEIVLQNLAINAFRGTENKSYDGEAVLLANRLMLGYIASALPSAIIVVTGLSLWKSAWSWMREIRSELKHPPKIVLYYTESPYRPSEELEYAQWADYVFTNERNFVERLRQFQPRTWYLPQAYDDQLHTPGDPVPHEYGTYFCGSGFLGRIKTLEAVDWASTGCPLTLKGLWRDIQPNSPLHPYYTEGLVPNERVIEDYRRSDICLNVHRMEGEAVVFERSEPNLYARERRPFKVTDAYSMNNRTLEIAASGGFQLVDDSRDEVAEVFGDSVPQFETNNAAHLQELVAYYAQRPELRAKKAQAARLRIEGRSYLANVKRVLSLIGG
jgi:hypothetical protein